MEYNQRLITAPLGNCRAICGGSGVVSPDVSRLSVAVGTILVAVTAVAFITATGAIDRGYGARIGGLCLVAAVTLIAMFIQTCANPGIIRKERAAAAAGGASPFSPAIIQVVKGYNVPMRFCNE